MPLRLYHHHIPRTGGSHTFVSLAQNKIFASDNLKKYQRNIYFKNFEKEDIEGINFITGHFGTSPYLIDNTIKGFTTIRNPVDRVISNFVPLYDYYSLFGDYPEEVKSNPLKCLDRWVNDDNDMLLKNNFQSRFLTNSLRTGETVNIIKNHEDPEQTLPVFMLMKDAWRIGLEDPTYETAKAAIDSMIVVGRTEKMNDFLDKIIPILSENYQVDVPNVKPIGRHNSRSMSTYLKNNISLQNIKKITELNQIDMEIWEGIA